MADIKDERLIELYCAADVYISLSRWEGYNLGIGQALAMGLPVIASDIPAHRAFEVFVSDSQFALLEHLTTLAGQKDADGPVVRKPVVSDWSASLTALQTMVEGCYDFPYSPTERRRDYKSANNSATSATERS
jgi:hypothetical protein